MLPAVVTIVYEEGPCLAVNKPGGLLTQAPPGIDSLEIRVKSLLKQRDCKTGNVYLGVPHRLDRPVTGVILFAKHVRAARRISEQFEGRTIKKTYWAFVEGQVPDDQGTWRDQLRKIPDQARVEVVQHNHSEGREAILRFRVLLRNPTGTLLQIQPETGRTHQIRVQAAVRGFPVQGDRMYGASKAFGPLIQDERSRWIALHAKSLAFRHPMNRQPVTVNTDLPRCWEQLHLPEKLLR